VLVLANFAMCLLLLFGKLVLFVFLGPLRLSEVSKMQDKMGSFAFFKLMFVAAMLEHSVGRADIWMAWLVTCGLLKVWSGSCSVVVFEACLNQTFALLGRERVEHLLGSGGQDRIHRPLLLVLIVLFLDLAVIGSALWLCQSVSFALLLCFECVCIGLDCIHAIAKVIGLSFVFGAPFLNEV
jgi:hypothetical protein